MHKRTTKSTSAIYFVLIVCLSASLTWQQKGFKSTIGHMSVSTLWWMHISQCCLLPWEVSTSTRLLDREERFLGWLGGGGGIIFRRKWLAIFKCSVSVMPQVCNRLNSELFFSTRQNFELFLLPSKHNSRSIRQKCSQNNLSLKLFKLPCRSSSWTDGKESQGNKTKNCMNQNGVYLAKKTSSRNSQGHRDLPNTLGRLKTCLIS